MSAVTAVLGLLLLASLASLLLSHRATLRHFADRSAPPVDCWPAVSLLKPTEGADEGTREAFASFCRLDYPGPRELLVGTVAPDDPVVAVVEQLQREFPELSIRLILAELQGTNRKTSIMEALWREATGELLFFSDADVRVAPDYLRQLVPRLLSPGVGCVTCLPRGIEARTVGGRLIALHYAFGYLPQWMLALRTTGIDWAIGHTMAVRREVLDALNGFTGFLDHLADDFELGHRTVGLGYTVAVPPLLLDCRMPAESMGAAWRRLLRWKRTMRRARGRLFAGAALTYPVFWAALLALVHNRDPRAWMLLVGVVALRLALAERLQRVTDLPDWPRARPLLPLADLLDGLSFVGAYTGRSIVWAGRRYRLRSDGTLEPLSP